MNYQDEMDLQAINDHAILFDLEFSQLLDYYSEHMFNYYVDCMADWYGGC